MATACTRVGRALLETPIGDRKQRLSPRFLAQNLELNRFDHLLSTMNTPGQVLLAPSPDSFAKYDAMYYIKSAAAGGICCSITHGALTPVDVVKTRVQLDPVKVGRAVFTRLSELPDCLAFHES